MAQPGSVRIFVVPAVAMLAVLLSACGDSPAPGPADSGGEAWWVLEAPGFEIADTAVYSEGQGPAGHRWTLEYSSGMETLQIVAFDRDSTMGEVVRELPATGEATIDGFTLTLRRSKGIPEDEIPPRFVADWADAGLLIHFGGTAEESQLRSLLRYLRRVNRERWDAEATKLAERTKGLPESPSPSLPGSPGPFPTNGTNQSPSTTPTPSAPQTPRASTTAITY